MKRSRRAQALEALRGHPEWEEMWAGRRNIAHQDAINESFHLQQIFRSMWRGGVDSSPVDLTELLRTLIRKKIPFVLTGAYAIGGWTGRPRSTHDVDLLVKGGRNLTRAVNAVKELYPQLEVRVVHGVTAFFVPGERESVIDITYPHREDLRESLEHPVWVDDRERGLRYRIPSLEAAMANKYGAMLNPMRDITKRLLDMADFALMVKHSQDEGMHSIDLSKLEALGELVWPGGGGKEILRLADEASAGRVIGFDSLGPR